MSRLQLFARFALDVLEEEQELGSDNDDEIFPFPSVAIVVKIRGLIKLADFLLDCRFMEVATRRQYWSHSAMAEALQTLQIEEDAVQDEETGTTATAERKKTQVEDWLDKSVGEAEVPPMGTSAGEKSD